MDAHPGLPSIWWWFLWDVVQWMLLSFLLFLLWEGGAGKQDEHLTCPVVFPMSFGGQRALQPSLGCGQQAGSIKAEQCMDALAQRQPLDALWRDGKHFWKWVGTHSLVSNSGKEGEAAACAGCSPGGVSTAQGLRGERAGDQEKGGPQTTAPPSLGASLVPTSTVQSEGQWPWGPRRYLLGWLRQGLMAFSGEPPHPFGPAIKELNDVS